MGTVKIKILNRAIEETMKQAKEVEDLLSPDACIELLNVRKEGLAIFKAHKEDYKTIAELLAPLAKRELELKKIIDKRLKVDTTKLTQKLRELDFELEELRHELAIEERKMKERGRLNE